jgi:hypothetical protein
MTFGLAASEHGADQMLSPELALIDPEFARWARERLPEPRPQSRDAVTGSREGLASRASVAGQSRTVPPSPLRPRLRVYAVFVAGAVFGLAAVVLRDAVRQPATRTARPHAAALHRVGGAAGTPTPSTAAPNVHFRPEATVTSPRSPAIAPAAAAPNGADLSKRFVWVRDRRATYYAVQFFRHGTKIFDRRSKHPALTPPPSWSYRGHRYALTPGQYRWVVRPGYGPTRRGKLGKAIVQSSLAVR